MSGQELACDSVQGVHDESVQHDHNFYASPPLLGSRKHDVGVNGSQSYQARSTFVNHTKIMEEEQK